MRKLLLGTALIAACLLLPRPSQAVVIDIGINPTSVTGNFSATPGAAAFVDQVTFTLVGGPQFLSIANATNTFANPAQDPIVNWVAAVYSAGLDGIVDAGGNDDVLLFGPQAASACPNVVNCQQVGGSGIIQAPGLYFAQFTGTGSGTSGYSGNISTFAVPGPLAGAGFPGLVMLAGVLGWRRLRRA